MQRHWDDRGAVVSSRVIRSAPVVTDIPPSIGPVMFGHLGGWVTVRCPRDLDPVMRRAGEMWDPGARCWLIERRRIGPVIRKLEQATDPLFRQAGIDLDG